MKPKVRHFDTPVLNDRLVKFIDDKFPEVKSPKGETYGDMDRLYGHDPGFTLLGDLVIDEIKETFKRDAEINLMWFTKCKDNIRVSPHAHVGDGDISFCYYPSIPDGCPGLGVQSGSDVYNLPVETGTLILFRCDDVHWVNPAKFSGYRYSIPGTVAFKE